MQRRPCRTAGKRGLGSARRLADYEPREARVIVEEAGATQWLIGFEMVLHRSESRVLHKCRRRSRVFVMWRMEQERAVPQFVTVSYDEASRWMDGGEQVDSVAMPAGCSVGGGVVEKTTAPAEEAHQAAIVPVAQRPGAQLMGDEKLDFLRRWSG